MKSKLLIVGGVIQILIAMLHVGIFFGISASSQLSANDKITSHIFNAAVLTTVLFFAYASLFQRKDLTKNVLGIAVFAFIAFFYLQRGLVELFLRGMDPVNLSLSLIIAGIYAIVAFRTKQELSMSEMGNKTQVS